MKSLGICVGATTLSAVGVRKDAQGRIQKEWVYVRAHDGNPREALLEALQGLPVREVQRIALTGRKFRHAVNLTSLPEPEAVETALFHLNGRGHRLNAVVSAGGETFLVYVIGPDGRIASVQTGNKCASGTGEFFMQQIRRIGISVDEAIRFASAETPYRVSGRCSVFCKSDCTHATNKGVPKGRIAAGLCEMMAGKILEILKQVPRENILMIGGTARNQVFVEYLRKEIPDLSVPPEAPYFEALGAALWGLHHDTQPLPPPERLLRRGEDSFFYLPPLADVRHQVEFRTRQRGQARAGDRCILGLDVGSTTTKAVILREEDDQILASVYLRTAGNPVQASRECYASLLSQLGDLADRIRIRGLGVTGSGRQIAGLHAMTEGIVNEIIAHATGALFFDPRVDTIFEIGGQDAKYTFIRNGIPSEYAMNEACSAGTGSFLEEAARETMGVAMEDIGEIALQGRRPPNFNDQCAAFISSDIKNAFYEGVSREDIVAGLVYSICMNYNNRVKGNRAVGDRIFIQGGVCYNQAVPLAMASLTGKKIVVPPEPGLMGAFGVALEIKRRLALGLLPEASFSLHALRDRELSYEKPFVCGGGKERCDRRCEIARIRIEDEVHPFGGACNRWYNLRFRIEVDTEPLDLVRVHERLVFADPEATSHLPALGTDAKSVGISKSFLVNTYYPLYAQFFRRLGFRVVLAGKATQTGMDRRRAAFCYPAEIAHGFFDDLLEKKPDYLFVPHLKGIPVANGHAQSIACPLSQGEPYYLASAFKDDPRLQERLRAGRLLRPVLDFSSGLADGEEAFTALGRQLGAGRKGSRAAFREALAVQEGVEKERRRQGQAFLRDLERDPSRFAVALLGRSYNAYAPEAHMGIPQKFASRGIAILPFDFLPIDEETVDHQMYWSTGQMILKGASLAKRHPQLFACYITNFSCGPDSFVLEYFRSLMDRKPFLVLELDSHVADAGLETRIEAFLDIIRNYREIAPEGERAGREETYRQAFFDAKRQTIVDSRGQEHPFTDPRVHMLIPSMGRYPNEAGAAVFRSMGVKTTALAPAGEAVLQAGRGNTSCKECLPLLLTVGSLLEYLKRRDNPDELVVYFMPTAQGPCRFGQYSPFIRHLVSERKLRDVALFSLDAENSYAGFQGNDFTLRVWTSLIVADIMQDVYAALLVAAEDREEALARHGAAWGRILRALEQGPTHAGVQALLASVAEDLRGIPLKRPVDEIPTILLTGEIFVRHDDLSRQFLVERLAEKGFATKVGSITEWVYYTDWCYNEGVSHGRPSLSEKVGLRVRLAWMRRYEKTFKAIMARSGLYRGLPEDVDHAIRQVRHLIHPRLTGEAILTVGMALSEVPDPYCGAIAIGPFGCMPNRLAEAVLSREMGLGWQDLAAGRLGRRGEVVRHIQELPFLAIESDGNPFPQLITARLEVFLMQAERLHQALRANRA